MKTLIYDWLWQLDKNSCSEQIFNLKKNCQNLWILKGKTKQNQFTVGTNKYNFMNLTTKLATCQLKFSNHYCKSYFHVRRYCLLEINLYMIRTCDRVKIHMENTPPGLILTYLTAFLISLFCSYPITCRNSRIH